MTWDRRLYFPSEERRADDFFALKNPTALAEFEPANLGTKGQHATPRPLKPLYIYIYKSKANPLQAWTGREGSRRLRLPDFKTIGK